MDTKELKILVGVVVVRGNDMVMSNATGNIRVTAV